MPANKAVLQSQSGSPADSAVLLELLNLDPSNGLISKLNKVGNQPQYLRAVQVLSRTYALPRELEALASGAPSAPQYKTLVLSLLRIVFAQSCYWKKYSKIFPQLIRHGLQDRGRTLSLTPVQLDEVEGHLNARATELAAIIDQLLAALQTGQRVDTSGKAFKRLDRSSRKLARSLQPRVPKKRTEDLDPYYPWASDPHSKKPLERALGIGKGQFSNLLRKHAPQLSELRVKHIEFDVVLRMLSSRLKPIGKVRARAFSDSLLHADHILAADPDRVAALFSLVKPYSSQKLLK